MLYILRLVCYWVSACDMNYIRGCYMKSWTWNDTTKLISYISRRRKFTPAAKVWLHVLCIYLFNYWVTWQLHYRPIHCFPYWVTLHILLYFSYLMTLYPCAVCQVFPLPKWFGYLKISFKILKHHHIDLTVVLKLERIMRVQSTAEVYG